ncbi:hypothetical protein OJAV_G00184480 [Oryzias javanicus]|uniref:DNA/RNA non-specific endonuclease domain-containing protein n=1 Tax=Oryzias javanicus TaxID=123683 RepID=A0A437CDE1_ORYJA|nr:hypothetical protein OJAV_G00184480 [Oryzias javanicus]
MLHIEKKKPEPGLFTECEKMLLFLLLVFLPAVPIETEVVGTLTDCPGFFVEETPPEIPNILVGGNIQDQNRYKVICQTFENKRRFLTLYDTKNKIPAFSAYRFTGGQSGRPKGNLWKIEPQLDNDKNLKKLEDYNQALNSEYTKNLDYNRDILEDLLVVVVMDEPNLLPSTPSLLVLKENDENCLDNTTNTHHCTNNQ